MADSADSTLNLLIKLGIIGLQEVQSAQQLLLETVRATHGMGDANTTLSRDAEIAIAAAKEHGLNLEGPLGAAILLASAVFEVKQHLKDSRKVEPATLTNGLVDCETLHQPATQNQGDAVA